MSWSVIAKLQKWSSVGKLWLSKMVSLARYAPNRRKFGIQTGVWGDFEGDSWCSMNLHHVQTMARCSQTDLLFTLPQGFTSAYMTSPAWSPRCPLCYLDSFRWFCSSCCLKSTIAIAIPLGHLAQISISSDGLSTGFLLLNNYYFLACKQTVTTYRCWGWDWECLEYFSDRYKM